MSGFAASNKVYNGDAIATISNAGTLNGVVTGDAGKVSLTNTGATFSDKNAETGKTVTLNGTGLSGTESGNYKLATAAVTTTADITPATLSYVANNVSIFQGQTPALSGSVTGFVGGESYDTEFATQALVWSSSGNTNVPGVYAVTGGGLSSNNYVLEQAAGNATALTVKAGLGQDVTLLQQVNAGGAPVGSSTVVETNVNRIQPSAGKRNNEDRDETADSSNTGVNLLTMTPPVNLPKNMGSAE